MVVLCGIVCLYCIVEVEIVICWMLICGKGDVGVGCFDGFCIVDVYVWIVVVFFVGNWGYGMCYVCVECVEWCVECVI